MEGIVLIIFSLIIFSIPLARKIYFSDIQNKEEKISTSRDLFFDWLKGLSIIAVIIIHVSYFYSFYFGQPHPFFNIINNLSRFAISIFFISSGILLKPLANKKSALTKFYTKKIVRIFLPYIIIVSALAMFTGTSIKHFLYLLISGQAAVPYYFVVVLLQFYLLYPALSLLRNSKIFLYISFLITLSSYLYPETWRIFGIPLFGKYLFFFQYGIYMRNYFIIYQKKYFQTQILFWLSIIIIYWLIVFNFDYRFYNVRLFYGLAIFNFLFLLRDKINLNNWLQKILIKSGQLSLWIFLLHFFVVELFYKLLNNYSHNIYLDFSIILLLSTIVSFGVAYICDIIYKGVLKLFK
ncbi:acyltransferase [Patescibacteria group bacterium]|nr:acyltransferase [Patescibacteria group bacterium]